MVTNYPAANVTRNAPRWALEIIRHLPLNMRSWVWPLATDGTGAALELTLSRFGWRMTAIPSIRWCGAKAAHLAATTLRHCRPHGQTHFMVARTAMIDADVRVPAFGKALDACDFHLLTAPACEPFSTAGF